MNRRYRKKKQQTPEPKKLFRILLSLCFRISSSKEFHCHELKDIFKNSHVNGFRTGLRALKRGIEVGLFKFLERAEASPHFECTFC